MFITEDHRTTIRMYMDSMNEMCDVLRAVAAYSKEEFLDDRMLQLASARALHIALESLTDAGNLIIDTLIMRDPSSYEDIVQVLAEEEVFPQGFAAGFLEVVRYRRTLAHHYLNMDVSHLYEMIIQHTADFDTCYSSILEYVKVSK